MWFQLLKGKITLRSVVQAAYTLASVMLTVSHQKSHLSWYQSPTQLPVAYRKVLDSHGPNSMIAIQEFDIFLVHCESTLYSYPLDMLVRVSQGELALEDLIKSEEKLGQDHGNISFFKAGRVANRTLSE
jgi:hypothetical protein